VRASHGVGSRRALLAACLAVAVLVPSAGLAVRPRTADAAAERRSAREQERLLAGHLLRRLGFGPDRREMREVLRLGRAAYIEQQLYPQYIDDRLGERRFRPLPGPTDDALSWPLRWLTRMTYSRRQLQEKMALIWHEHFATSVNGVGSLDLLRDQEELFRTRGLGNFRDLLIAVSLDNAMLIYLNNSANNGRAVDEDGTRVPPNENYARELFQLFSLGVHQLNRDGTLVVDGEGRPLPAYSETDVRETARALTGWIANFPHGNSPENPTEVVPPSFFVPNLHDDGVKTVLGEVVTPDPSNPRGDLERVADIIMRQPNTAPFIAKMLILKLATETPSPDYVRRVANIFAFTRGDIRATLRAILTDAEFTSPAVVRTQHKTPIEYFVGALRGLGADARRGTTLYDLLLQSGHMPYLPPSVFSFYRPGQKSALVNAGYVGVRDQGLDRVVNNPADNYYDAEWDAGLLLRRQHLAIRRPQIAVDLLARDLLAAPLGDATRAAVLDYIGAELTEEKLRGAAWLILCSPEYQAN
jgi:uncharacterized protein (DUF1800 family)